MNRPRWQGLAEALYGILLRLYPRGIRERHGEEMRQAFRDRCREAGAGQVPAWRLFFLELAPDFATSLVDARFAEPGSPRRVGLGLASVLLLGSLFLFHDAISSRILDGAFATNLRWQHWQQERALARDEARLRALARQLEASPEGRDRSLAAWLYAFVYKGRSLQATYLNGSTGPMGFEPLVADGEQAVRVLDTLPRAPDVATARMALAACQVGVRCDRMARAQALVRIEPQNAYGWSELMKLHSQAENDEGVRASLHSLAQARYYDDGVRRGREALLSAAARLAPGDAATTAAVGRALMSATAMTTDDFPHDLRYLCIANKPGTTAPPRWVQRHPGSRGDCRRAAVLLANSNQGLDAVWGWFILDRDSPSEQTRIGKEMARARLQHEMRDIGSVPLGERSWRPWTDAEWQSWADAELIAVNP